MKKDSNCFTSDSTTRKPTGEGKLSELSFALKDLASIKGHISSFGHPQWRKTHKPADKDSSVLSALLNEGAELIGTAKMDQLAYSIIGNIGEGDAPINTKHPERFCGGSSSGSASAVAGGFVDFAVGSDTGGSVRIPAAACGIYGIRTTHGLVATNGVIPLAESADVIGFFARSPELLGKVTSVFSKDKNYKIKRLIFPKNISEFTNLAVEELKAEAVRVAKANNLDFVEEDISEFVSQEVKDMFARNQSREIWKAHGEWAEENMQFLAKEVQDRLNKCKGLAGDDEATVRKDKEAHKSYRDKLESYLGGDSVLALPILPMSGPNRNMTDEESLNFRNRAFMLVAPSSLSGLPQVSAPVQSTTTNIGLIGPRYSDLQLIELFM